MDGWIDRLIDSYESTLIFDQLMPGSQQIFRGRHVISVSQPILV